MSIGKDEIIAPVFSSDLAYLERIHRLLMNLQDLGSNGDYGQSYYFTCEQLHIELRPRIKFQDDLDACSKAKSIAYKTIMHNGNRLQMHKHLSHYHALLNGFAHKYKLILRDQETVGQTMDRGI